MIREFGPDDRARVGSDWIRSYATSTWASHLSGAPRPNSEYWTGHRALIDRLFDDAPRTRIDVDEREGLIAGWVCWQPGMIPVLHYIYVRPLFRGQGVARGLLGDLVTQPVVCSHVAREVRKLPPAWRVDRYVLLGGST